MARLEEVALASWPIYEQVLAYNARLMLEQGRPGDVVLLHDPQTAGLAPALMQHGAIVAWRSHVGGDAELLSPRALTQYLELVARLDERSEIEGGGGSDGSAGEAGDLPRGIDPAEAR